MIFGIFGGKTGAAIQKRVEKLAQEKVSIATAVDAASADRYAALAELQKDIEALAGIKAAL